MRSLVDYLNLIRITAWRPLRYQVSNQEHIAILDAILQQQQETACQLLTEHIQLSYQEAINTMMHSSLCGKQPAPASFGEAIVAFSLIIDIFIYISSSSSSSSSTSGCCSLI